MPQNKASNGVAGAALRRAPPPVPNEDSNETNDSRRKESRLISTEICGDMLPAVTGTNLTGKEL